MNQQPPISVRIPGLDGLRGIAAIVVITVHSFFNAPSDMINAVDKMVNLGIRVVAPSAVDLFFVLSGYLITSILDDTRRSTHPFATFYARRFLRIFPLYALFLIVLPVIFDHPAVTGTPDTRVSEWLFLTNLVMTQQTPDQFGSMFGHLWSLAIEEQFYLVWPLVILLIPARRLPAVCLGLILLSFAGRVAFDAAAKAHYGWLLMPTRLDGMAAGALVALLQRRDPALLSRWASRLLKPTAVMAGLFCIVLLASFWKSNAALYDTFGTALLGRRLEIMFSPLIGAVLFACVVARVSSEGNRNRYTWLQTPALRRVGQSSYGMYLFHGAITALLVIFGVPRDPREFGALNLPFQAAFSILIVVVSHAFGLFTWHVYEKQLLKLAPRYRYQAQPADEPAVAAPASPVMPAP